MKTRSALHCLKTGSLALLLLLPFPLAAQTEMKRGLNSICREQAENYVGFLADDLLEGRDAGMRGGKIAAAYIVSLLKDWGIQPLAPTATCNLSWRHNSPSHSAALGRFTPTASAAYRAKVLTACAK